MSAPVRPGTRFLLKALIVASLPFLGAGGCTLDDVRFPPLLGPSEQGISIELRAVPNILAADGVSTSTVTILVRNQDGAPFPNRQLFVQQTSGDGFVIAAAVFVGPLQDGFSVATAGNGIAQFVYQAGTFSGTRVWFRVRSYSTDSAAGGEPDHWVAIEQR